LDGLRVEIGSARDVLARTTEQHENAAAYAEGLIADIEGIDRTEVIVKLQDQQRVLEASYAMLARLQSLSLLNYL
jgi:flagellin-like hook-associated protein FlgL